MFVTKENGSIYNEINKNIIKFHIENKWVISFVNRILNYKEINIQTFGDSLSGNNIYLEYTDDITPQEIQEGSNAVKEYCTNNSCLGLYYDYVSAIAKTDDEKLNALKEKKKYEINVLRDNILYYKPFFYNTNNYQIDNKSRELINANANSDLPTIKWISLANDIVTFTNAEFKQFNDAILKYTSDITIKARQLKNSIILAQTIEEVNNINWEN